VRPAVELRLEALSWPVLLPLLRKNMLDRVATSRYRRVRILGSESVFHRLEQHPEPAARELAVDVRGDQRGPDLLVARPVGAL